MGGGEEEATGHLVLGVVWVFYLDDPRFPPVDTGDDAHLHAPGVRDVVFGDDEGVVGTIPPPPLWGGLSWGRAFVARGGGLRGAISCWGGWLHLMSHGTQHGIWSFSCHHFW